MPFNGAGLFTRVHNWVTDKANGVKITASRMDAEFDGMATGLATCVTKDGQTVITANLPMGGFRHTGAGDAANPQDYATLKQVTDRVVSAFPNNTTTVLRGDGTFSGTLTGTLSLEDVTASDLVTAARTSVAPTDLDIAAINTTAGSTVCTGTATAASLASSILRSTGVTAAFRSQVTTPAVVYTQAYQAQFYATNTTKGTGSTITTSAGLRVDDLTQGGSNFGVDLKLSSGANKYNVYAQGTAANYFAGNVGIGAAPERPLHVEASGAALHLASLTNTAVDGYSSVVVENNSGTTKMALGYANASAGSFAGLCFLDLAASTPFTFNAGSVERLRFDDLTWKFTGAVRLQADFSNATISSRMAFQSSTTNGATGLVVLPNGTSVYAGISLFELSTPNDSGFLSLFTGSSGHFIDSGNTGSGTTRAMQLAIDGTAALTLDTNRNVAVGTAALNTTATDGFLYIPTCAGTPTGVPTAKTGLVPLVFDSSNNKLYVYDGGWLATAALT